MSEILIGCWIVCALWLLLELSWWALAASIVLAIIYMIGRRKGKRTEKLHAKRLQDIGDYLEQVLTAFGRDGKIDMALEQAEEAFFEGEMRRTLQEAKLRMHMSVAEDVYKDGLDVIYENYPCERVRKVNEFMLHAEYYGGDMDQSVQLLLADVRAWRKRCEWAMQDRRLGYRNVIMSVAMSVLICSMVLHLPMMDLSISSFLPVQIVSVVVLALDVLILLRAQRYLQVDWLKLDEDRSGCDFEREMEEFRSYDPKKQRRLSILLACACGGVMGLFLWKRNFMVALVLGAVGLFFLHQHEIGHRIKERKVARQIRRDFPVWMMDMVLLLQGENVQMAIEKSGIHAPQVLKADIWQLNARLAMDPESYEPYSHFLPEFPLPEIRSGLRILYSISVGNTGGNDHRIEDLISSNNEMLESAQKEWLRDRNSGLYLLFLAPVMTASMKLLTDMTMFMMTFLAAGHL